MATFLYTAVSPRGVTITQRLEASSAEEVRLLLEAKGFSQIVFHTDDYSAKLDEKLFAETGGKRCETCVSPEEQKAIRYGNGVAQTVFRAWRANAILWTPLVTWDVITLLRGQPYPLRGWIGFGLTGLFFVYFVWVVLPGIAYKKMLEASLWFRWEETRRWIRFLRGLKRFGVKPLVNLELDFRYAYSLAAEGRLNDALAMVRKYENHICGKYIYFARLSGLYEVAGDYPKMTECRRVAAQNGNGLAAEHLDIALGLLRRERNPAAAREVVSRFRVDDCSELAKSYFKYCEGLLAIEEGDWTKAEVELNSAIKLATPFSQHVLAKGLINEMKAFLGVSVARLGRQEEAQRLFQETSPLLKARKEDLLLNRLQDALNARPSTRAQFAVCPDVKRAA